MNSPVRSNFQQLYTTTKPRPDRPPATLYAWYVGETVLVGGPPITSLAHIDFEAGILSLEVTANALTIGHLVGSVSIGSFDIRTTKFLLMVLHQTD